MKGFYNQKVWRDKSQIEMSTGLKKKSKLNFISKVFFLIYRETNH
jgi:hypothetical protein